MSRGMFVVAEALEEVFEQGGRGVGMEDWGWLV